MIQSDRRAALKFLAGVLPLLALSQAGAIAGGNPRALDRWAQDVADLNAALRDCKVTNLEWQARIAALHADVDVADLVRYLDFDRLTHNMRFPTGLAETADPQFPTHIQIGGAPRRWFIRFFGMRRGGAIIPHVHNNMVSAHLVLSGSFRARTFDRVRDDSDDPGAVYLKRRIDDTIAMGGTITMSDDSHIILLVFYIIQCITS